MRLNIADIVYSLIQKITILGIIKCENLKILLYFQVNVANQRVQS